jgi:hypothetical protein
MLLESRNLVLGDYLENETRKEAIYMLDRISFGDENIHQLR